MQSLRALLASRLRLGSSARKEFPLNKCQGAAMSSQLTDVLLQ
jgi:hypothetical protein